MLRRSGLLSLLAVLVIAPVAAFADPIIYLSTYSDNKIYKVAPDGTRTQFGPALPGGGPMAFDKAGNLYTSNYDNGTIYKVASNGTFTTFASGLHNPYGIAFDTTGNLYVSNANSWNLISKITPGGTVSDFAYTSGNSLNTVNGNQPEQLAFDAAGNLYAATISDGKVQKITPGGVVSTFISGLQTPTSLAIDSAGFFYVGQFSNSNGASKVSKYSPNGAFVSDFVAGINNPYELLFGQDTNLYISTYPIGGGLGSVLKVTPGGSVSVFTSGVTNPTGLAIPVPEPMSLCVLAGSSVALMMRRSRRR